MTLTVIEQYLLELINRGRLDPAAEAARLGIDLNASLAPGTITADAKQVLAHNTQLGIAAEGHSDWMLANSDFSHTGAQNSTPGDRMAAAGYNFYGNWTWAENIAWYGTTGPINLEDAMISHHDGLFVSSGHRVNLMNPVVREIGVAQETGPFTHTNGTTYNASLLTEKFAKVGTDNNVLVTGVVYDDTNGDRFYSIGEGRDGATFAVGTAQSVTASAGGYGLAVVGSANMVVTVSSPLVTASIGLNTAGQNAKLDIVNGAWAYTSVDTTLLTGLDNARLLGVANLSLTGNGMANDLIGNDGDNVLFGQAGNDVIDGGAGNDTLFGGLGDDILYGGAGTDRAVFQIASTEVTANREGTSIVLSSAGGDETVRNDVEFLEFTDTVLTYAQASVLVAASGAVNRVTGDATSQTLYGTEGVDFIEGLGGFDWIVPGRGDDTVDGGADRDMVSYSDVAEVAGRGGNFMVDLDLGAGTARIFGGEVDQLISIERATGSIYADVMRGSDGNDELRGSGDYDWFIATAGNDTLNGGNGLDTITFLEWGGSGAPVIESIFAYSGAPPSGAAVGGVVLDLANGANNTALAERLTLLSVERVTGSSYQDVFYGDGAQNDFRGLGGYDWFVGSGGGRERYYGDSGLDTVTYFQSGAGVNASLRNGAGLSGGQETGYGWAGDAARDLYFEIENLVGSNWDDRLEGNAERNQLSGLDGDDYLLGYGGVDYLMGGAGDDTLDGGGGSDYALFGSNRADYTLTRTSATEVSITGADGSDRLVNIEYFQFDDTIATIWELDIA